MTRLRTNPIINAIKFLGIFSLAISLLTPIIQTQAADTCTWQGGVDNLFFTPGNWINCNGQSPASGDNVVFPAQENPLTVVLQPNFFPINSLTLNGNVTINGSGSSDIFFGSGSFHHIV